jgi:hypothetical protein
MENLLAILAVGGFSVLVTGVIALVSSQRVGAWGLFGSLMQEFSVTARFRNPYRG